MTVATLQTIVTALLTSVDPCTGEIITAPDSCLTRPSVRSALQRLERALSGADAVAIPDEEVRTACEDLRRLGYEPFAMQLAKVFIGSRSIADARLQGLPCFRRYRGRFTRTIIRDHLLDFAARHPDVLGAQRPGAGPAKRSRADQPWREVDFFTSGAFDHLEDAKAEELRRSVKGLDLTKSTGDLPEHMASSRSRHSRAYEPWTREEKALLIEAMCYTNDLKRLEPIFGRSGSSLKSAGQRLIYASRKEERA